ncbi:TadE/TadG family type IV pilus assembly protein [Sinomonas sp. JGH33]|uniref:TadE/TadG family type IV pilus assembly protein n=1 Tax=Sinomonas terricola TaxID=3110330 RepID=A0ABU5T190_9MICC|nr:TadE/TadG family type IV pilus assembly protein [Sinomonas sp. JGH33]MEA5453423.1 TadE/TadG family type IV pilus assembly protein [Sinomonas sp. JGH33]
MAVEFAIIAPLLLALLGGIVEFSRIYNAQILVTNAAREAARTMALTNDANAATSAAQKVASPYTVTVTFSPSSCTSGSQIASNVASDVSLLTGNWLGFGSSIHITGVGAMRCGG